MSEPGHLTTDDPRPTRHRGWTRFLAPMLVAGTVALKLVGSLKFLGKIGRAHV